MNDNINLTKILKDCPKGTKLYSSVFGEVELYEVESWNEHPIHIKIHDVRHELLTSEGKLYKEYNGECILFPSKDQRDWSKFKLKKERFDPKTLKPYDKVLARDSGAYSWKCTFYSHINKNNSPFKYITDYSAYEFCIPYNEETKHLAGTTDDAPEFYR